jgi:hypothetical protein
MTSDSSTSRYYHRTFLNDEGFHGTAAALAHIDIERYDNLASPTVQGCLQISDCSRAVTLDFAVHSAAEAVNAVLKARRLRDLLAEFCAELEGACAEVGFRASDAA